MNLYVRSSVALLLVIFSCVAISRDLDQDEALRLREKGIIQPLHELLQKALERHPGAKLLEAELEEDDDIYVYEVELLTQDGVVRELKLNAANGQWLKDEVDD